ncbi:uncharacterized protein [Epargyreus clarus]|uniref:uncharacterized protein n=1 Tax=Epargyreus clarus TaxID=520877 RepID=UPI003C2C0CCF
MNDHKILLFILSVIVYCLYSVQMWFLTTNVNDVKPQMPEVNAVDTQIRPMVAENGKHNLQATKKTKAIPLCMKYACSVLDVFTEKPKIQIKKPAQNKKPKEMEPENNTITVIGITVFLIILVLNAILDIIKVKEEEKARLKLNPDGERRKSLSEFANKKSLRRESSKFGFHLFQIAESVMGTGEDKKCRRESRPYTRGDSINSYLSDKTKKSESSPPSIGEIPNDQRPVKRQSVAKLFGARPVPMVRRSSFPALPLNPEIQALMLGSRQPSFDSDDEDGKGRRVRIIRRY